MLLRSNEPLAVATTKAIHNGDVEALRRLLAENPGLAAARVASSDPRSVGSRSLLHLVTDWPGHFPRGAETVAALVAAGADVSAQFVGKHAETPLHWAASCDDVAVLDALLDAGAEIDAKGSVLGGGSPLADAVGFGQWKAALRLVERGAHVELHHAAALGLLDRVEAYFAQQPPPDQDERDHAFWYACHGAQQRAAEYLLERGAELNWIPHWEDLTPLDVARRSNAVELAGWLLARGAKSAEQLGT